MNPDTHEEIEIAPGKFILITKRVRDNAAAARMRLEIRREIYRQARIGNKYSRLILEEAIKLYRELGKKEGFRISGIPYDSVRSYFKQTYPGQYFMAKPRDPNRPKRVVNHGKVGRPPSMKTLALRAEAAERARLGQVAIRGHRKPKSQTYAHPIGPVRALRSPRIKPFLDDRIHRWRIVPNARGPYRPRLKRMPLEGPAKLPLPSVQCDPVWARPWQSRALRGAGI